MATTETPLRGTGRLCLNLAHEWTLGYHVRPNPGGYRQEKGPRRALIARAKELGMHALFLDHSPALTPITEVA